MDKVFIQTQTIRENDLTHDAAISVRSFHLNRDLPAECHVRRDLFSSATEGLPFLGAVYSVEAHFHGSAIADNRDGVAIGYPYYFARERVGLRRYRDG